MSLDFALKDFYRKKESNYPYVLIIALIVGVSIFLIYFTSSLGLNSFIQDFSLGNYDDASFFSGSIKLLYSQFNTLILVLIFCLTFVIVVVITTTLAISKKRDIGIMKSLGTLPERLYGFYLLEVYIIFILGFILGLIFGLVSFGIFTLITFILGYTIAFQIDVIFTPILFFSCAGGIYFITGYTIRKIGMQSITKLFSKNIPCDYDASKGFTLVPRWLSSLGMNFKIAIINIVRKKGEFKRYVVVFSLIFLVIFTFGLGIIVINSSSREWIKKSQGENLIVIGHGDVVYHYSLLYKMFSDSRVSVSQDDIDFTNSRYLFSASKANKISLMDDIERVDKRLIKFCDVEEKDGVYYSADEGYGDEGYIVIGQQRTGNIPIIGLNPTNANVNFEIEGSFFSVENSSEYMVIGDGLAYSFFDYAFDQGLILTSLGHSSRISGVVIDSFYGGNAGYINLELFQEILELNKQEVNLILVKYKSGTYNKMKEQLENIIKVNLGEEFTHLNLNETFENNLNYLSTLSLYSGLLIAIMGVITFMILFNYQKGGLFEKARDFTIMRAIGARSKSLKRILFLESFFVSSPSLLISLSFGMIFNALFLLEKAYLPPLHVPFLLISFNFLISILLNYLSLIPLMRKLKNFRIKNFEIY